MGARYRTAAAVMENARGDIRKEEEGEAGGNGHITFRYWPKTNT